MEYCLLKALLYTCARNSPTLSDLEALMSKFISGFLLIGAVTFVGIFTYYNYLPASKSPSQEETRRPELENKKREAELRRQERSKERARKQRRGGEALKRQESEPERQAEENARQEEQEPRRREAETQRQQEREKELQ